MLLVDSSDEAATDPDRRGSYSAAQSEPQSPLSSAPSPNTRRTGNAVVQKLYGRYMVGFRA